MKNSLNACLCWRFEQDHRKHFVPLPSDLLHVIVSRMQFRVVVPQDVISGVKRMICPDGTEADTIVPAAHKPGDTFLIELPGE